MTDPRVGSFRELPTESSRPDYQPKVGKYRTLPGTVNNQGTARLIYLDEVRVRSLLEQIAAVASGRQSLGAYAPINPRGVIVKEYNPWTVLANLAEMADENAFVDLCESRPLDIDSNLHPSQAVGLKGLVPTARDVTPSGFPLSIARQSFRVLVDRIHALHLNQAYLTSWTVAVLGRVHSVPRLQVRAAAILVIDAPSPLIRS